MYDTYVILATNDGLMPISQHGQFTNFWQWHTYIDIYCIKANVNPDESITNWYEE